MPVRTYRGPLWKYRHPVKYLRSEFRRARYHMRLDRVLWRVFGPGTAPPSWKARTTRVNERSRRRRVARTRNRRPAGY